ncbi:MAG TPA: DNA polymerase III subunit gamma and tau [Jatrophihabitans sp.]|nr:DNA polymerase III subunit gamma and tau [Jatrophihabitans sp.]
MALALYRKYRSATFAEVIGQEHVTEPLMQALSAGRINHAYLFSGPRGCGKTSSARILARSLNCAQGPTPTPCGECESCRDLAPNGAGSIDVIEIDAASHGGVDDARDLRERAYYAPVRDRYKVYIIDEAHMVTTQGFNALLKLVEEPPDFLIFIFATTEPDKVLQTIRSRTHHYPFRLIPPTALRAHLERICQAEGATVEPAVFPLVVRAGAGSARDSLSVLDQLLAGAGPEGVTYGRAVGLLGVTDATLLDDVTDSLAVGDAAAVYATIDRVVEAGHDPRRFAADLLDRFRDLILLDAVPDAVAQGMIDYPGDQAERMADQSRRIGLATLVRYADITHTTLTDMRGTTSPRLMLELLCARMLLPDASTDSTALLQRIERLERRQGMAADEPRRPADPAPRARAATPEPVRRGADTAAEPAATVPGGSEPDAPAPRAAEPSATEAGSTEPRTSEPRTSEPRTSEARTAGPGAAEPSTAEARSAEPRATEPGGAEPAPAAGRPPVTTQQPAAPPAPAEAAGTRPAPDSVDLRRYWPQVLDRVRDRSRRTRALLDNAPIGSVEGTVIRLAASSAVIAKMVSDDSNLSVLREALADFVGGGWQIEVGVEGGGTAQRDPRPAVRAPAAPPPPPVDEAAEVDEETDAVSAANPPGGGDAEAAALALLQSGLGARRIEQS